MDQMKTDILSSSSAFQIGGQPGHSPEELIFCLKSLIHEQEVKKKGLLFILMDIVKFFDKESIYDVMQTLSDINVNKKTARVWYKLNEDTKVSVKTAMGMSDAAEVGSCIGQGTSGGALVSQINLDQGLQSYITYSTDEMYYGKVRIQPVAYQDDVGRPSRTVEEAQAGSLKLSYMLQVKGLEAHPDKTCFIVFLSLIHI